MNILTPKDYSTINSDLALIPRAELKDIVVDGNVETHFKAVKVSDEVVAVTSDHYKLVQHEEAFRPILEALVMREKAYKYSLIVNHKRAWLNIFVGSGYDGINFGFKVVNSIDRSTAINYGMKANSITTTLELVGYRLACSNGMIMRVPLANAEFVKLEERQAIEQLLSKKMIIRHQGDIQTKMDEVQYTAEAFLLLEKPLQRIIQKAQSIKLYREQALEIIKKYVGARKYEKILHQFSGEEQSLWGLYNAMTFIASHRATIKATKFNTELNQAATMLEQELITPAL